MTIEFRVSAAKFPALLRSNTRSLNRAIKRAIKKTSRDTVRPIVENAPKAFGELRDSVHDSTRNGEPSTRVSAPHAAAVEVGSRPHLVPLDELTRWVKLRGMQGLTDKGRIKKSLLNANPKRIGSTTAIHALTVAVELKSMQRGRALDIDAPEQIARRIQQQILKNGTKPHWYVREMLPKVRAMLGRNIKHALENAIVRG